MSSLVERLRVRSQKRPVYTFESDSDDDLSPRDGAGKDWQDDVPVERVEREDAKKDACQRCGKNDNLVSCSTCTYAFHRKCLVPCLNVESDTWSCPECVSPLTEMEKILDCQTITSEDTNSSESGSKDIKQYLIKWKGLSYIHCSWISEKEYLEAAQIHPQLKRRLKNFHRQMDLIDKSDDDFAAIRSEWTTVHRILASRKNSIGEQEYYVKWKELSYEECSWESESDILAFRTEIERFHDIQLRRKNSGYKGKNIIREACKFKETPNFLSGGTLHPYQLEGLNFLRNSWYHKKRVILGDEMGLGKTIQCIAFLASLFEDKFGPHLVVAPLSILRNWEREFATWAPQMNVVMYFGTATSRDNIRKHEFYYPKEEFNKLKKKKSSRSHEEKQSRIKFDVLLISYEMINMDSDFLKNIKWECLVVDEGHRLKNKDSKLFGQLKDYHTNHRVLLTGTPVQNNLDELFVLMHFLEGESFGSMCDLQEEFKEINQDKQIEKLHGMLKPHILRRFKEDVLEEKIPPKKELKLKVELTSKQKEYYRAILTKNYDVLARRSGGQISLRNVVMELRKLCCHVFMIEYPDSKPANPEEGLRRLLDASGKMQLLDKMMVKLKEQGHRVLIYSQFQHMLDLLEDYLSYRKWGYERIDGKIAGAERQIRIDRFNTNNSAKFCFLLSTRAGGLGINLATADTVIIYDSDWNPHADIQAMARAHRLGQTNKVMIYRFVSRGTIEERMMEISEGKKQLEGLVVGQSTKANNVNKGELDDIIRYGSRELFEDEKDEAGKCRQIHYDDAAIERLLDRDRAVKEEFTEVPEIEVIERPDYWEELLKDKYDVKKVEEHTTMGKGKRSRKQMVTADEDDIHGLNSEDDYSNEDDVSYNDTILPGSTTESRGQYSKRKSCNVNLIPLMEGEGRSMKVLGFNRAQRLLFIQTLNRYGFQNYDWKDYLPRLKGKSAEEIQKYAELVMVHLVDETNDPEHFSDGVPKEGLRIDETLVRIANISLIKEKVAATEQGKNTKLFPDYLLQEFQSMYSGKIWKEEHDLLLLKGILKHGYARWQSILNERANGLFEAARLERNLPSIGELVDSDANEGNLEGTEEGHVSPTSLGHHKEIQRKIVDFIKKRYHHLEKCLNLEYFVKRTNTPVPGDLTDQSGPAGPVPQSPEVISRAFPNLEPIYQSVPAGPVPQSPEVISRAFPNLEPIYQSVPAGPVPQSPEVISRAFPNLEPIYHSVPAGPVPQSPEVISRAFPNLEPIYQSVPAGPIPQSPEVISRAFPNLEPIYQSVPAGPVPQSPEVISRAFPNLEPICTNEVASGGTTHQSVFPNLYNNTMCSVLEDSGVAAPNSSFGYKAPSCSLASSSHRRLETVCKNIVQALRVQENNTATKEGVINTNSKEVIGEPSTSKTEDKMEIDG